MLYHKTPADAKPINKADGAWAVIKRLHWGNDNAAIAKALVCADQVFFIIKDDYQLYSGMSGLRLITAVVIQHDPLPMNMHCSVANTFFRFRPHRYSIESHCVPNAFS